MLAPMFAASAVLLAPMPSGQPLLYRSQDVVCEGYLALPKGKGPHPLVLVVHAWGGLGAYERSRADMLTSMGYAAFAVDIYGKGIRPTDRSERGRLAGQYKADRALYRSRLNSALKVVAASSWADTARVGAIGYCFGGTGVLELARMGAPVRAVVSFHGGLDASPKVPTAQTIQTHVMVAHGAADPFVPPTQVNDFMGEMLKSQAPLTFVSYPGAVHSFTEKEAGNNPAMGAAYDARADKESWAAMTTFFAGHLGGKR